MALPTAVAEIPSITTLRQELNYGDSRLPRCKEFCDDLRAFTKRFISSRGLPGRSFHDWNSQDHQTGLAQMTRAYLDRDGNGPLFWPDDQSSPRYNGLKYCKDFARIKQLMVQLFFRLNHQHHRSNKNKNKARTTETNTAKERGSSPNSPIDVDAIDDGTSVLPTTERDVLERLATSNFRFRSHTVVGDNDAWQGLHAADATGTRNLDRDAYRVPESPGLGTRVPKLQGPVALMAPCMSGARRSPNDDEPLSKRAKTKGKTAFSAPGRGDGKPTTSTQAHRPPPRRKQVRRNPMWATAEEVAAALESLERITSPARVGDVDREPDAGGGETSTGLNSHHNPQPPVADDALRQESTDRFIHQTIREMNEELDRHEHRSSSRSTGDNVVSPQDSNDNREPSASSVAPPSGAEDLNTDGVNDGKFGPPEPLTPRPPVEFRYRVLSHQPYFQCREWDPKGRFRDISFSELQNELPVQSQVITKGLHFRLLGPGMDVKQSVCYGQEHHFDVVKRFLENAIRMCIAQSADDGHPTLIEIEIEALGDERTAEGKAYDGDFVW